MFAYKCVDSTIKRPNLLVRKSDTACITQHAFLSRNNSISLYTLYKLQIKCLLTALAYVANSDE